MLPNMGGVRWAKKTRSHEKPPLHVEWLATSPSRTTSVHAALWRALTTYPLVGSDDERGMLSQRWRP